MFEKLSVFCDAFRTLYKSCNEWANNILIVILTDLNRDQRDKRLHIG